MKKLISVTACLFSSLVWGQPTTPINNARITGTSSATTFGVGTGAATVSTELEVDSTSTSSPRGIMSAQFNTGTDGARFHGRKARGTRASPLVVVTGDNLARWVGSGYDGSNYLEMASIIFGTEGTIASTRVPTNISFWTATNAAPSVLTQALLLDSTQKATFGGTITFSGTSSITSAAGQPLVLATGTSGTALSFTSATNVGTFSKSLVVDQASGDVGFTLKRNGTTNTTLLGDGANTYIQSGTGMGLIFQTDGSTALSIASATNRVAIGNPSSLGSIFNVNSEMSVGPDSDNRAIFGFSSGCAYIGTVNSATAYFDTFNVKNGNIGIGTTTPLSKLSINGGLHVGGDSDAGDNNLLVDGVATIAGSALGIGGAADANIPLKVLGAVTLLNFTSGSDIDWVSQQNTQTIATGNAGVGYGYWTRPNITAGTQAYYVGYTSDAANGTVTNYTRFYAGTRAVTAGNYAFYGASDGGKVYIGDATASTSTTTGSLINAGGFGNAGAFYNGGIIHLVNNGGQIIGRNSTDVADIEMMRVDSSNFVHIAAGGNAVKISGAVTMADITEASALGTASVVLSGGLSVAKSIISGGSSFTGINAAGSFDFIANRQNTSTAATVQYKTGATLNWYHGTRGLADNNWYLFNNGTSVNSVRVNYSDDAWNFASTVEATTGGVGSLTTAGGIYAAKKIYPAGGLIGTPTNTTQGSGIVGERMSSIVISTNAVSLTTATTADVTSITLTPGNWIVWGKVNYTLTGVTGTDYKYGQSTTSATLGSDPTYGELPLVTTTLSGTLKQNIPQQSYSVATATTTQVFLVAQATFTVGTGAAFGEIYALRTD